MKPIIVIPSSKPEEIEEFLRESFKIQTADRKETQRRSIRAFQETLEIESKKLGKKRSKFSRKLVQNRISDLRAEIKKRKSETLYTHSRQWVKIQLLNYRSLLNRFESIRFYSSDVVVAVTKPILLEDHDPRNSYRHLGRFKVELNRGDSIKISNLDFPRKGVLHPHIQDGGTDICWGNIKEQVRRTVFHQSFVESLMWIDEFLHHYVSGHYAEMSDFKKAPMAMVQQAEREGWL